MVLVGNITNFMRFNVWLYVFFRKKKINNHQPKELLLMKLRNKMLNVNERVRGGYANNVMFPKIIHIKINIKIHA